MTRTKYEISHNLYSTVQLYAGIFCGGRATEVPVMFSNRRECVECQRPHVIRILSSLLALLPPEEALCERTPKRASLSQYPSRFRNGSPTAIVMLNRPEPRGTRKVSRAAPKHGIADGMPHDKIATACAQRLRVCPGKDSVRIPGIMHD
jgi:hypothetical protein